MFDLERLKALHPGPFGWWREKLASGPTPHAGRILLAGAKALGVAVKYSARRVLAPGAYRPPQGRIVFLCLTKNQADAVGPVVKALGSEAVTVSPDSAWVFGQYHYAMSRVALRALFSVPTLLRLFRAGDSTESAVLSSAATDMLMSLGTDDVAPRLLKSWRPRALVVATDHSFAARSLVLRARTVGIPTFYMQHGAVTQSFPRTITDFSLLDGEDARSKYLAAGSGEEGLLLVGMPKLDAHIGRGTRLERLERVGIATNSMDGSERLRALLGQIAMRLPDLDVVLRPHPREAQGRHREWAERWNLEISDSRVETAAEFLAGIDVVIAGDSGILLEAALLNVTPVYFGSPSSDLYDYYGFVERGIATAATTAEDVVACLSAWRTRRPDVRARCQYYCATLGTEYEGRSAELAATTILEHSRRSHRSGLGG